MLPVVASVRRFGAVLVCLLPTLACSSAGRVRESADAPMVQSLSHAELLRLGAEEFDAGRIDRARGYFRHVLKYDPRNARAHLALAATFDVEAAGGSSSPREIAEVGYAQALQFDPRNWLAAYRLGVLELSDGNYDAATGHLARAAVLRRGDAEILGDLARALYLDNQLPHAMAVAEEAISGAPNDPELLRHGAIIAAAVGDTLQARQWQSRFSRVSPDEASRAELARRVDDWGFDRKRFSLGETTTTRGLLLGDTTPGMPAAQRSPFLTPGVTEARTTLLQPIPVPPAGTRARMVQVDAILIRTQEIETNARGVNLLRNLQLQFGGQRARTVTRAGAEGTILDGSVSQTLSRTLSLPDVKYSLEIANTGYDRSDVLARPTLVALDGQPANFFVGEELSIPVTAQLSSNLIDKTVGIELAVTPTFLDDNTVILSVSAQRSFLNTFFVPEANSALRTTQQRVTTSIVSDFGRTVVLSGLTEHESKTTVEGVPVLQELPGIQYLFSNKNKLMFESSVMIALTPRPVGQTGVGRSAQAGSVEMEGVTQMEDYFPDLTKRARALAVLGKNLQQNAFKSLLSVDDMSAQDPFNHRSATARLSKQLRTLLFY